MQVSLIAALRLRFEAHCWRYTYNLTLHDVGWGEEARSELLISGIEGSATASLFDSRGTSYAGDSNWGLQNFKASTVAMAEFCREHHIAATAYVVIDVEGYEPKVIRGMHLDEISNQKRFPHFQYELGGSWAARDPRHGGTSEWSQHDACLHLQECGYMMFMIGKQVWMEVGPEFFKEGPHMLDEGHGLFVQGNLLCLHSHFSHPSLLRAAQLSSRNFKSSMYDQ